jgi:hypothetical protein
MAKGQKRSNREARKPKKAKQPVAESSSPQKGLTASFGSLRKKP